nr:MAG TPA: hypothetical protein [Caudoviricetes sp.]
MLIYDLLSAYSFTNQNLSTVLPAIYYIDRRFS